MQRGAEEAAERLGVTLVVQAAEREVDVEKQMQIVENLIQTEGRRRCASRRAARAKSCPPSSRRNGAGIPVRHRRHARRCRRLLAESKGKIATFIGSDNYEGGKLAGEFIAKR